jgi:hypothetical protein
LERHLILGQRLLPIATSQHQPTLRRPIAPFVRRQSHNRVVDRSINSQRVIERLFRPFPPKIEGTAREF